MAQTSAERQARYRKRRPDAGDNGDRRLDLWVTTGTALALSRLARHHGIRNRAMLERLILTADKRVSDKLEYPSPEWTAYMSVTG
jgi:hypothetical protein